ncbi:hydroxymethylglutaryl-CoA reductase, degradative [Lactobacillus sp. PV034]|uniref:hydroxymethylglutaryl-CoA reductase, degradative n=1 Tax=Lactobacillus sp. PV034 TaxID=2594495 RepID=UPI00223FE269|nr:hydroxymethylglutaryl-CoA reductase, degradative [Lactobacillus sp. PV034]QNQ80760.1 hydroxymethylglutaryl-CoA reductase, degradative [Lactobacillus sp. PV034]
MKFYKLSPEKRRALLKQQGIDLSPISPAQLTAMDNLSENVVGSICLPLGIVEKLLVNGKEYMVPMATEEPSVIAAANHGSKIFARHGGVKVKNQRKGIYGQIVLQVNKTFKLKSIKDKIPNLIDVANHQFTSLINHGGGVKKITIRQEKQLVYLKVLVDPAQAMGANKTNAILEFLANLLVDFDGVEEKLFAILSNYPSQLATGRVSLPVNSLGGKEVAAKIALLSQIGIEDPYRGATNNKGIMNGVDAVLIATGNDFRAVEAAAAVLAGENGYHSLSSWKLEEDSLVGQLTLPMPIGVVGGSISARSDIQDAYQILGDVDSETLASIIVGIGLANNLAALLAISTAGIQAGHMRLQARNMVATLETTAENKELILKQMRKDKKYTLEYAKELLKKLQEKK